MTISQFSGVYYRRWPEGVDGEAREDEQIEEAQ